MNYKRAFLSVLTFAVTLTWGQDLLAAMESPAAKVRLSSFELDKISRTKSGLEHLKNLDVYLGQSFIVRYAKLSEDGLDSRNTQETTKTVYHSSNNMKIIDFEVSRGQITKIYVSPDASCKDKSCSLVFEETANSFYLAAVPEKIGFSEVTVNGQRILDDLGIPSAFRRSDRPEHVYMIGESSKKIRIPLRINKSDRSRLVKAPSNS